MLPENESEKMSLEYQLVYGDPTDHRGPLQLDGTGEVDPLDNDPVAEFVKANVFGDLEPTQELVKRSGSASDRLDAQLAAFFIGHPKELEEARALVTGLRTYLREELVGA
jgi:hypothetical protein